MAFIVILIVLGIQRYLQFYSHQYHIDWMHGYFSWMNTKLTQVTKGHGLLGLAILIVPIILIVAIVFALIFHLFGIIGYFVLSLVFLWYCIDARDLHKHPYDVQSPKELFLITYKKLFSILFWYGLFGPVGLALYFSVAQLFEYLSKQEDEAVKALQSSSELVLGILGWVPLRLLGLSFALVGHFASTMKVWTKELFSGVRRNQTQAITWGCAALQADENALTEEQQANILLMIDHALLVWLVVMALINIAMWLG